MDRKEDHVVVKFQPQDLLPLVRDKKNARRILREHGDEITQAMLEAGWNVITEKAK